MKNLSKEEQIALKIFQRSKKSYTLSPQIGLRQKRSDNGHHNFCFYDRVNGEVLSGLITRQRAGWHCEIIQMDLSKQPPNSSMKRFEAELPKWIEENNQCGWEKSQGG